MHNLSRNHAAVVCLKHKWRLSRRRDIIFVGNNESATLCALPTHIPVNTGVCETHETPTAHWSEHMQPQSEVKDLWPSLGIVSDLVAMEVGAWSLTRLLSSKLVFR